MTTNAKLKPALPEGQQLYTTAEVADLLRISVRKVYALASTGTLKRVKFGRSTRYRSADVARLAEKGCA